ncbi:MAG: GNAT family N-acetyltransferase [Fimbriimonadaceae bacterium]|nr:GNAT family N-acetyltransferase [Fimbriimonadaceae bacterium]
MATIRPLTAADLPALARRLQAGFPADGYDVDNLAEKVFGDADYDETLCLAATSAVGLEGGLIGVRRGPRAFVKALTTWPDEHLADVLLADFEARVRGLGASSVEIAASAPCYFLPGVDPTDTATLRFYQARGYERSRDAFNMTSDLTADLSTDDDEARLAAAGFQLRRLTAADQPALAQFMATHFSEGWLIETSLALRRQPVSCWLAWRQDQLVAFAADEVTNPGWFGPMGTDPAFRRHGLGRVLLRLCLQDLRSRGYRQAQIGWVGPWRFYQRHCGAVISRVFWQLRKEL